MDNAEYKCKLPRIVIWLLKPHTEVVWDAFYHILSWCVPDKDETADLLAVT